MNFAHRAPLERLGFKSILPSSTFVSDTLLRIAFVFERSSLFQSGVGKSSLTNRLLGEPAQTVSAVRENDTRGRHTTTGRELFVLPSGALLIDTPGMREFALFADDDTGLHGSGFPEIDELSSACRFRDCRHENEPGCAVLAAVEAGNVAGERLDQAHKFERELAW